MFTLDEYRAALNRISSTLSDEQRDVLACLLGAGVNGITNVEVADHLGMSPVRVNHALGTVGRRVFEVLGHDNEGRQNWPALAQGTSVPGRGYVWTLHDAAREALAELVAAGKTVPPLRGRRPPAGNPSPVRVTQAVVRFERDPSVVAWVLEQAAGSCEACGSPAPFVDDLGVPFLEVHHPPPRGS